MKAKGILLDCEINCPSHGIPCFTEVSLSRNKMERNKTFPMKFCSELLMKNEGERNFVRLQIELPILRNSGIPCFTKVSLSRNETERKKHHDHFCFQKRNYAHSCYAKWNRILSVFCSAKQTKQLSLSPSFVFRRIIFTKIGNPSRLS